MYEQFADRYAELARGGSTRPVTLAVAERLLHRAGDVRGLKVVDAGCGEGQVARLFARHGAKVTGVDISPRMIELAQNHSEQTASPIEYKVLDLREPQSQWHGEFDITTANMVLDDVDDYRAFLRTISIGLMRGARFLLFINNPYSVVLRGRIENYFDSGAVGRVGGFEKLGFSVPYHHQTFEDYVEAFRSSGVAIRGIEDVRPAPDTVHSDSHSVVPHIMILDLDRE